MSIQESSKGYFIDWNVMQKEGMTIADIPNEYTIINIPFKALHPVLWWSGLLGSIFFILGLLSGITYLYWRETQKKRSILYELEDEKESLALAVEGSDTYAWRLKNNMMVFENAFWKNLDITPRPLTIQEFLSFVDAEYLSAAQFLLAKNAISSKHFIKLKCDFNGKGYQWWELRCSTMESALGGQKTTGLLLNIEDYKKREQELIEARKMAEKAELKESFLANMSHEIRTPLNAIVGFSTMLASPDDTDISQEEKDLYVETIHRNNELLLKLVNDILEISRIESGYMSFKYDDYPLATLINDTYQTHKVLISQNINFIQEESGEDIIVHLDKDRLIQVITNLLNNAVKFTQEGYIKLGWKYLSQNEEVEIYVEDSGIGIPQSEQKMIFNRFYKQNEFAQGTGLGLSICKVIVEKLQGRLSLQSIAGVGKPLLHFLFLQKAILINSVSVLHKDICPVTARLQDGDQWQIPLHHPAFFRMQRVPGLHRIVFLQCLPVGWIIRDTKHPRSPGLYITVVYQAGYKPHIHAQIDFHTRMDAKHRKESEPANHHIYSQITGILRS